MGSKDLHNANKAKADEFYTQLHDIEKELKHYTQFFKNKTILCNCDDPYESNFFYYFATRFNELGLKKLICTCYVGSTISYTQLTFEEIFKTSIPDIPERKAYKIIITEVNDANNDGAIDIADVEFLIKNKNNTLTVLEGDGDFRTEECKELLKKSDIVVTNPPFSLFREYIAQLTEYKKSFIIIGNVNAINYKEIFPLFQDNKLWLGYNSGDMEFTVPSHYEPRETRYREENGIKYRSMGNIYWFTNLDIDKRHEELVPYKKYNSKDYIKYDNYDAINIDKVTDIPSDYTGVMGVPITFMDKYNPDQFVILGLSQKYGFGLESNKLYNDYAEMRQDGTKTGSSGKKTNGNPMIKGIPTKGNYYTNGKDYAYSLYGRIFIRKK